ncbi:3-deoxy-D-manno-octulosonic acid transferase [Endozoicomonas sp. OPT23]|uniref:lipid IV(A) 3-deoxy-D-manno-octulosonic acid transferase n=1 Tax=Endozoicomonas sp. OPT23 TaxID=2072845 RepID=UPI00129B98D7|nr:lipid IV(A) 3-deoxy-D-manno-octulosonic acid transferase [Endozoicomonas sp. OPT23]MRI31925.1 3-deoxy-D-manno-octulosonic acid transferase [Endozoicomonas sp. OPT23]
MSRIIYSFLLYLAVPLVLLKMYLRGRKAPAYHKRWCERFAFIKALPDNKPVIWVHSVSVGETIASAPMVKQLMALYPNHQFVVTTMTPTGSDRVKALYGDTVHHVYCPYDLPDVQSRFLNRIRPTLALMMETELWPNTVAACHKRNIPIVIANARLSEKSAKGYGKLGGLTRQMMEQITLVACQNSTDGERFKQLGLTDKQLRITGSVKFDITVDSEIHRQANELRKRWETGAERKRDILIAASTHQGEDEQVIAAFKQVLAKNKDALLVLVPRHPERFNQVFQLIEGNNLSAIRHSQTSETTPETQVILGDTMGELMKLYATADLAFVGGSLVENGGHNMLEPAALGTPVLSGPSIFNFNEISQELVSSGGMKLVQSSNELAEQASELLASSDLRNSMGEKGKIFVESNRGALQELLNLVQKTLKV